MGFQVKATLLTVREYIELEKQSLEKHEYQYGEIFAMAGATPAHALITGNFIREIGNALKGKSCSVYSSDLQVVLNDDAYVYPDVTVICGEPEFGAINEIAVKNPTLIVEVHSDSTANYDRGGKFERYRKLSSLKEYVLAEQNLAKVECWYRLDSNIWQINTWEGLQEIVQLQSIEVELSMEEIYAKVDFMTGEV